MFNLRLKKILKLLHHVLADLVHDFWDFATWGPRPANGTSRSNYLIIRKSIGIAACAVFRRQTARGWTGRSPISLPWRGI
jgi:hypothetical protein